MMRQTITLTLLVAFVMVATFGAFSIDLYLHGHGSCILQTAGRAPCPANDIFESLAFHMGVLNGFSQASFNVSFLIFFLVLGFLLLQDFIKLEQFFLSVSFGHIAHQSEDSSTSKFRIQRWLTLQQHNPTW